MVNKIIYGTSYIRIPSVSTNNFYCTEAEWRQESGYVNASEFTGADAQIHLKNATEQLKKDAFYKLKYELVVKDGFNRFFSIYNHWGNAPAVFDSKGNSSIRHDVVTKYDIQIWLSENQATSLLVTRVAGLRRRKIYTRVPHDEIIEIDPYNGFFRLNPDFDTGGRRVHITYFASGKPLDESTYELKQACIFGTTLQALKKHKRKRMKNATTHMTGGNQTVTRDEKEFAKFYEEQRKEYHHWVNWLKPFVGRRVKVGRVETADYNIRFN